MTAKTITQILPVVRRKVLTLRSEKPEDPKHDHCGFGLSYFTIDIAFALGQPVRYSNSGGPHARFTSGSPKKLRGLVQACLAILAREGIMYGRNHPEGGVQSYEHCETDKRFRVRISQAEAKRRLAKMS